MTVHCSTMKAVLVVLTQRHNAVTENREEAVLGLSLITKITTAYLAPWTFKQPKWLHSTLLMC